MKKNGWDPKVPDFIWNKNRLELEKQALKANLMKVINKPTKGPENEEAGEEMKKEVKKSNIAVSLNQLTFQVDTSKRMTEIKPTAIAGQGIVSGGTKPNYADLQNQQALGLGGNDQQK